MDHKLFTVFMFLIFLSACVKTASKDDGIVEVVQLSEDCEKGAEDACCQAQCTSFCESKSRSYTKNIVNGASCGCWCD
jgi:hypothetical protein